MRKVRVAPKGMGLNDFVAEQEGFFADEGIEVFSLPVGSLAVIVLLGGLAGMAAAVLPSRRAARLDVLRAVASE